MKKTHFNEKTEERHKNECETRKTMSTNKLRKEHE
jgi:hypothetical protein